jgi:pimeloyl-ACP methyl ester carboxylesterase
MPSDLSAVPELQHDLVRSPGADPERWMLVLHGIYGAGRNWASVARRFVRARPDWGAVLVDLRGHGTSNGFRPPHTVDACAADLDRLVSARGFNAAAILGHSFGGKVALRYARLAAVSPQAPHLERVWVVDSTPAVRPPGGSAWGMLRVLRLQPGPFEDREAGIAAVESEGYTNPVAQWMSTNLVRADDGRLVWRLDPAVMEALLRDFFDLDAWDIVEHPPAGTVLHVVKARDSSVIDQPTRLRLETAGLAAGAVLLHEIDGGHWLNADNPDALQDLLITHMP